MRIGIAVAAAVLLVSCSSGSAPPQDPPAPTRSAATGAPTPTPTPGLAGYYGQSLRWTGCGDGFECATLRVPRDYADPAGVDDIGIEVIRLPSSGDDRIGSLVVNPGGPGASGIEYARAANAIVSRDVLSAYDIVGFDPRGVGASAPVECMNDAETDALIETDPTPDDESEIEELFAATGRVGMQCERRSPLTFRWLDTVSAARDMDILRASLGDDRLYYLGKSYGTALGTVYAEQFPDNVGRLVLDGALPLDLTSADIALGQAMGFEVALQRFVQDCLDRRECPLSGSTVPEGVAEIQRFLGDLDAEPIPAKGDDRDLTEALGVTAVLYYLYSPPNDWALLRDGLAAAFSGDGSVLLGMLDRRLHRDSDSGEYISNMQEAFYAVTCLDRSASSSEQIEQQAQSWALDAPTFGPYLAWSDAVCAQWPVPPVSEPRVITAEGAGPVLVVSTQYDPATPYEWGVRMAATFSDAALVSFNGDGHTAYRHGSACVDAAVDAYLLRGELPAADPRCGY